MPLTTPSDPADSPAADRVKGVARLGLGLSRVGSLGNPASPAELRALMRRALDLGVVVFDTADIYGQGDSERELGRALAGRRDQAFVVTKFGKLFSPAARLLRPFKPVLKPLLKLKGAGAAVTAQRDGVMREDFTPARLAGALDASLRRLRMDHVDAALLHSPPLAVLNDPAMAPALTAIRRSGKARHVGVSIETGPELDAALALDGVTVLQIPYDLVPRLAEPAIARRIDAGELMVHAREVLRLQPDRPAAQALTAALANPRIAAALVGTSKIEHLEALARAAAASPDAHRRPSGPSSP
jgi:aryl-alcohol dehydrogenase-like predicted oxidoreductase